jgi:murein DD-endopeptidase MepM/ murein hydrolase activator NlpD
VRSENSNLSAVTVNIDSSGIPDVKPTLSGKEASLGNLQLSTLGLSARSWTVNIWATNAGNTTAVKNTVTLNIVDVWLEQPAVQSIKQGDRLTLDSGSVRVSDGGSITKLEFGIHNTNINKPAVPYYASNASLVGLEFETENLQAGLYEIKVYAFIYAGRDTNGNELPLIQKELEQRISFEVRGAELPPQQGWLTVDGWRWPVNSPSTTNPWGRLWGGASNHRHNGRRHLGYDLGSSGTAVFATSAGTVRFSEASFTAGEHFIVIEHTLPSGQTVFSFYDHLRSTNVSKGNQVFMGQRIGTTNTHLHFAFVDRAGSGGAHMGWAERNFFNGTDNSTRSGREGCNAIFYNPMYVLQHGRLPSGISSANLSEDIQSPPWWGDIDNFDDNIIQIYPTSTPPMIIHSDVVLTVQNTTGQSRGIATF